MKIYRVIVQLAIIHIVGKIQAMYKYFLPYPDVVLGRKLFSSSWAAQPPLYPSLSYPLYEFYWRVLSCVLWEGGSVHERLDLCSALFSKSGSSGTSISYSHFFTRCNLPDAVVGRFNAATFFRYSFHDTMI